MSPATIALSSIASGAVSGIAGRISLTRIGIPAPPNRVWADSFLNLLPTRPLAIAQQSSCEFLTEAPPPLASKDTEWRHSPSARHAQFIPGEKNPLANAIITLTTDYGTNDHLVGTLKGVILKINPDVTIVDITHNVTPFDLLDGALAIGSAYSYFPAKTIHVVVVDPGVGTERRPLLVSAQNQYFVAPDNGVLSVIYEREAEGLIVRHANVEHYYLQPMSKTFHGRDVFAPVLPGFQKAGKRPAWRRNQRLQAVFHSAPQGSGRSREGRSAARRCVRQFDYEFPRGRFAGIGAERWRDKASSGDSSGYANGGYVCARQQRRGHRLCGVEWLHRDCGEQGNAARTLNLGRGAPVILAK